MDISGSSDVSRLLLIVVFTLAVVVKMRGLSVGRYGWHPLLISAGLQRNATFVVGVAAAVEIAIIVLLALAPRLGGGLGVLVLAGYTLIGFQHRQALVRSSSCRCLATALDGGTFNFFLVRNIFLLAMATICATRSGSLTTTMVASTFPGLSIILGVWVFAAQRSRRGKRIQA